MKTNNPLSNITEVKVGGDWMEIVEWFGDTLTVIRYSNNGFFKEVFEINENEIEEMM